MQSLFEKIVETSKIPLPASMIDQELNLRVEPVLGMVRGTPMDVDNRPVGVGLVSRVFAEEILLLGGGEGGVGVS